MSEEAKIERSEEGAHAASPGWFVLNVAEARWGQHDIAGRWTELEPPEGFEHYGIGIHVLEPGQPTEREVPLRERAGGLPRALRRVHPDRRG